MDRSDEKTADFGRRTSRRMSRQVSIHTNTDLNDSVSNDAYLAAMGISVSDGFRPSNNAAPTPAAAIPDHQHPISISTQKSPETDPRSSVSDEFRDEHLPATTNIARETSSSSSGASTLSSLGSSSEPSPSEPSSFSLSQTSPRPSSAPISVPGTNDQAASAASATSASSQAPPTSPQTTSASRARPSSIAKPPVDAHPPGGAALHNAASGSSSSQRATNVRESTTSSVAPPPQQDEPYQGPSGPSFPYQMYPQNVRVTRNLSSVTTPTDARSESSYTGPRGPAFPYGMYPQNTMASSVAGPSTVPASSIPVGFPGIADNYQRRIGPDGEDIADMIGPDGHTEQLPPYTRYPDEAYTRKIAASSEIQPPDPLTSRPMMTPSSVPVAGMFPNSVPITVEDMTSIPPAPEPAPTSSPLPTAEPAHASAPPVITSAAATAPAAGSIPGAGGIGLAPRNPEYDGAEDSGSPRSHYSLRSFNSEGTGPEINTAARGITEKRKPQTFIQRFGGRRISGVIPYWAICLVATALLLMGIILGAVIGTFVARHKRAQSHHGSGPQSVTVTVDAVPIPTPTNLAILPTGVFSLPLMKEECPGACFNDTTQAKAWSCSIPFQYGMSMTINGLAPTPDGPMYNISIDCNMSATVANNVFLYGEQAPVMSTPMPMQLVNDTLDPTRGPAWFQMLPYNKTVVVHESYLSPPSATPASGSANQRRGRDSIAAASPAWGEADDPFSRKDFIPAQAGDKPWVCTWPDTVLEVFIYPNQNASFHNMSRPPPPPFYTSSLAIPTPASGSLPSPGGPMSGAMVRPTGGPPLTGAINPTDFPGPIPSPGMPPMPPPFPRVVKVEERRMAKSPQATCVQYELTAEGFGLKAEPHLDEDGNIIEITIAEIQSGPSLFSQAKLGDSNDEAYESDDEVFDKRDFSGLSKCGCLWMVM